jgi:hypothetical protein
MTYRINEDKTEQNKLNQADRLAVLKAPELLTSSSYTPFISMVKTTYFRLGWYSRSEITF